MNTLSHLDEQGRARMLDVAHKPPTARTATAEGQLRTTAQVTALVRSDNLPKADVLATARIAGISAAKRTSELIPLCHQLALSSVTVEFDVNDPVIIVRSTAKTVDRTGVEMEALTAVAVAALTLHDMVKAVDPAATIESVRLISKSGGKHGLWARSVPRPSLASADADNPTAAVLSVRPQTERPYQEGLVGNHITSWLAMSGFDVRDPIVCDERTFDSAMSDALIGCPRLILVTTGNGERPLDTIVAATRARSTRQNRFGQPPNGCAQRTPAEDGLDINWVEGSLVVNIPGSALGVMSALTALAQHFEQLFDYTDPRDI